MLNHSTNLLDHFEAIRKSFKEKLKDSNLKLLSDDIKQNYYSAVEINSQQIQNIYQQYPAESVINYLIDENITNPIIWRHFGQAGLDLKSALDIGIHQKAFDIAGTLLQIGVHPDEYSVYFALQEAQQENYLVNTLLSHSSTRLDTLLPVALDGLQNNSYSKLILDLLDNPQEICSQITKMEQPDIVEYFISNCESLDNIEVSSLNAAQAIHTKVEDNPDISLPFSLTTNDFILSFVSQFSGTANSTENIQAVLRSSKDFGTIYNDVQVQFLTGFYQNNSSIPINDKGYAYMRDIADARDASDNHRDHKSDSLDILRDKIVTEYANGTTELMSHLIQLSMYHTSYQANTLKQNITDIVGKFCQLNDCTIFYTQNFEHLPVEPFTFKGLRYEPSEQDILINTLSNYTNSHVIMRLVEYISHNVYGNKLGYSENSNPFGTLKNNILDLAESALDYLSQFFNTQDAKAYVNQLTDVTAKLKGTQENFNTACFETLENIEAYPLPGYIAASLNRDVTSISCPQIMQDYLFLEADYLLESLPQFAPIREYYSNYFIMDAYTILE